MNTVPGINENERALPPVLRGFSWAAFLWGGIWAVTYRVWIGLFAFIPFFGLVMNVLLGLHGNEWAFRKGAVQDIARYKSAQRNWVIVWVVLAGLSIPAGVGLSAALAIFGVRKYVVNAKRVEAQQALVQLAKGMAACSARSEVPKTSNWVPADLSAVRDMTYQSLSTEWSSEAAFSCARFALSEPQYFRYRWVQVTSASGQFEAEADLNGDGTADNTMQQGVHCSAGVCEVEPLLTGTPGTPY